MRGTFRYLKKKSNQLVSKLHTLPKTLALLWTATRRWTIGWILLLLIQKLLPVAMVYLTRSVVNHLAIVVRSGGDLPNVRGAVVSAGLLALVFALGQVL